MAALLVACAATDEPEEEEKPPQARPQIVGRVASIPPGRSFLLIQSIGEWRIVDGTILTTRGGEDRSANLLFTGERLGQFAAADIQSGQVEVGDAVLLLPAVVPRPDPAPAEHVEPEPEVENPG